MFRKRAESNKSNGDRLYAQAKSAEERGDSAKHKQYMAQAQAQYKMQKENDAKAAQHEGKTWK